MNRPSLHSDNDYGVNTQSDPALEWRDRWTVGAKEAGNAARGVVLEAGASAAAAEAAAQAAEATYAMATAGFVPLNERFGYADPSEYGRRERPPVSYLRNAVSFAFVVLSKRGTDLESLAAAGRAAANATVYLDSSIVDRGAITMAGAAAALAAVRVIESESRGSTTTKPSNEKAVKEKTQ